MELPSDRGRVRTTLEDWGAGDPFAAAVRGAQTPMLITDPRRPDNPITFANDAFLGLTGYLSEEVVGRNCRFLQGEGTDADAVRQIREAVAAQRDVTVELLNYKKSGEAFRNALYIGPVRDAAGEVLFFFASQLDVTARSMREEVSRRREAELRLIVEGARDYAIITTDRRRRVTGWSSGAEGAFGWTAAEMMGQPVDAIFMPADLAEDVPGREAATAAAAGSAAAARWHRRKDGSSVFMSGSVHALPLDGSGREQGLVTIARDETARRQADERLRESEEFNRRVLGASADCIKVLDLNGSLEFMSEGGMCVMEVENFEAIAGASWPGFWPGAGRAKALAAIEEARRGGTARFQHAAPTMKGSMRLWDVIVSPIEGADGRPEKLLSVSRDVTSASESEERLREGEERLRLATEAAEVGFWDVDLVNDSLVWPPLVKAMFGISADVPVTMRDFYDGLHPEDRDATAAAFLAATDPVRRALYDVDYRTVGKEDGVVRWVTAKGRGLFDEAGRCVRVIGTAIDTTVRRRNEARLRELNDSLEEQVAIRTGERNQLWELSRDVMLRCTGDGRILTVNPAWTEVLGWREDELVGSSLFGLLHPEELEATRLGAAAHAGGTAWTRFEARFRHRDGSHRWISWSSRPAGDVITAVGRDVTAERASAEALARTEEALRQSHKMEAVGQLTGGLAHDFNNLLAGISGALELMGMRINQGRLGEVEKYMLAAQGATKRAAALTHRLLAFSRRQTLLPKPVNVNRLVTGILEMIERTVGPAIRVENVGASGLWTALVDPSQLENSLLNLCINARDAMPQGGRLTIETCNRWIDRELGRKLGMPEGQYLSLCVSDTGVGMPPDVVEKAFDPFFTTKPMGEGTGLGLSMIYGFAKQSGGQVRIYSEVGQGTMVCIYLPRHSGKPEEDEPERWPEAAGHAEAGETVLVVDDEPTIRLLVSDVLEELGYTAIEASDSAAGLRVLQSDVRIDLLISDIGLPGGMNGRQMADAARPHRPDLKVLFITGFAENALLNGGQLEPGMAVLTKPFAVDVLAARVREMVGRRG